MMEPVEVRDADPADLRRIAAIHDEQVLAMIALPNDASEALRRGYCGGRDGSRFR